MPKKRRISGPYRGSYLTFCRNLRIFSKKAKPGKKHKAKYKTNSLCTAGDRILVCDVGL